jgi:hypothetical protein
MSDSVSFDKFKRDLLLCGIKDIEPELFFLVCGAL